MLQASDTGRVRTEDVVTLETLGNLRAVGLSIEDMRAYLASARRGDEAAGTDAAYALDPEAAERLWAVSDQMNR